MTVRMPDHIEIAGRRLGPGMPAYVVAELSCNHRHDYAIAEATVRAAAGAGADAVKLQTYTADTLTLDVDNDHFRIDGGTLWDGRTLHDLYEEAYTPWDWHAPLMELAASLGMACFSSPFDASAVELLTGLDVPAYKIASFEITDVALIRHVASKGRPVVISTGIARPDDIDLALETCRNEGNDRIVLLKCTSAYPSTLAEANVRTMADMRERYGVHVGVSDHAGGSTVPVVAVALGGVMVEKHLIVDRSVGGPDAAFSMEPDEFAAMVAAVRDAEAALGEVTYELTPRAEGNRHFARSLFVAEDVAAGEELTGANVRSVRPGDGMHPRHLPEVLGRRASRDLKKGEPLDDSMIG